MQMTDKLPAPMPRAPGANRIVALLAVVAISDFLIFGQAPGLNLFLFAILVAATLLLSARRRARPLTEVLLFGLSAFAAAPLIETPSPMGVAVSLGAIMCVALASARLVPHRLSGLPPVLFRFVLVVPLRLLQDCRKHLASRAERSPFAAIWRNLGIWMVPLILASVFLLLFAIANPLIEDALRSIDLAFLLQFMDLWRIGFWMTTAAFVWAMLRPRLKRRTARHRAHDPAAGDIEIPFLTHASLLRSLLLFNALFAMQTLLDLVYLWGGVDLPDGMTHAEYAHRGAYPLIATALLAAAFVLIAMRRGGPGDKSPLIRSLVHVWIGQNVLLCLSSILRLDLYVEVYSLTELRVAAGIWMGLVAVGLVLILMRIVLRQSNQWLIATNIAVLASVLYLSAIIDFPAFIARFNVTHSLELSHEGVPLDIGYLSSLGPSAIPALDLYLSALPEEAIDKKHRALSVRQSLAYDFACRPRDWRSWSFRAERIEAYLRSPATIAR
ncbi:ABC transporter, ATP-binding protein CydD [Neorhizobium galegae bv. orientalis]|nr:ABC transporter, ATP-binding protein CydD [Neorhizobium galegae bv. orientalis]